MTWEKVKEEALIACKRHCCICETFKGINIEVHHIIQKADGGSDDFDNAIPLCFDCHCMIGGYNPKHPKGNKFTTTELKRRRDEFYNKIKNAPMNSQVFFQNMQNSKTVTSSDWEERWRQLGTALANYQRAIDYAYVCWESNFKGKYRHIHEGNELIFNLDYQNLQNEIDKYGDNLYRDIFVNISGDYYESKNQLANAINNIYIDISKELYDKLVAYMNCMMFKYESDGGVGLVDYYWSSFFVCLDKNYSSMKELKEQIDELIREEYKQK